MQASPEPSREDAEGGSDPQQHLHWNSSEARWRIIDISPVRRDGMPSEEELPPASVVEAHQPPRHDATPRRQSKQSPFWRELDTFIAQGGPQTRSVLIAAEETPAIARRERLSRWPVVVLVVVAALLALTLAVLALDLFAPQLLPPLVPR